MLVVEDGTGIANANSYVSVAEADTYFEDRNLLTLWAGTDEAKEGALISATDYINIRYGNRFMGVRLTDDQALPWPRDTDEVLGAMPLALRVATMEYAVRALQGRLWPDGTQTGHVRRVLEVVGPIKTETEYFNKTGMQLNYIPYPYADALMLSLLTRVAFGQVIRN